VVKRIKEGNGRSRRRKVVTRVIREWSVKITCCSGNICDIGGKRCVVFGGDNRIMEGRNRTTTVGRVTTGGSMMMKSSDGCSSNAGARSGRNINKISGMSGGGTTVCDVVDVVGAIGKSSKATAIGKQSIKATKDGGGSAGTKGTGASMGHCSGRWAKRTTSACIIRTKWSGTTMNRAKGLLLKRILNVSAATIVGGGTAVCHLVRGIKATKDGIGGTLLLSHGTLLLSHAVKNGLDDLGLRVIHGRRRQVAASTELVEPIRVRP
jgi:hypothetical protein